MRDIINPVVAEENKIEGPAPRTLSIARASQSFKGDVRRRSGKAGPAFPDHALGIICTYILAWRGRQMNCRAPATDSQVKHPHRQAKAATRGEGWFLRAVGGAPGGHSPPPPRGGRKAPCSATCSSRSAVITPAEILLEPDIEADEEVAEPISRIFRWASPVQAVAPSDGKDGPGKAPHDGLERQLNGEIEVRRDQEPAGPSMTSRR